MAKIVKSVFLCFVVLALISSSIPEVSSSAIAVVEKTAQVTALGVLTSAAATVVNWLLYIPVFILRQVVRSAFSLVLAPLLVPIKIVRGIIRVITFPFRLVWNVITFPIRLIINIVMLPYNIVKAVVRFPSAVVHTAGRILL